MNNSTQQTFDFSEFEPQPKMVKSFFEFHERQPKVYEAIKEKCHQALNKTKRNIGFRMIYEASRWEVFIQNDEHEIFKMNNNYCPAYLRMFLRDFPMYSGRIEKRKSIFDDFIK